MEHVAGVSTILGRDESIYLSPGLRGKTIMVTGGKGALGVALGSYLTRLKCRAFSYDIDNGGDVLDLEQVVENMRGVDLVFHLAAAKHAPAGEIYPFETAEVNIRGTQNVVAAARAAEVETLVFASTCKAAQPETCYGASKLVGERIVLNAGYTVARLYNVIESSRNVFEIWDEEYEDSGKISVADGTSRYFISLKEAVSFIASCAVREPGRYVPYAGDPIQVREAANRFLGTKDDYTGSAVEWISPRRGDRMVEPRWAKNEWGIACSDASQKVVGSHD